MLSSSGYLKALLILHEPWFESWHSIQVFAIPDVGDDKMYVNRLFKYR
jgi:hypothetical protein